MPTPTIRMPRLVCTDTLPLALRYSRVTKYVHNNLSPFCTALVSIPQAFHYNGMKATLSNTDKLKIENLLESANQCELELNYYCRYTSSTLYCRQKIHSILSHSSWGEQSVPAWRKPLWLWSGAAMHSGARCKGILTVCLSVNTVNQLLCTLLTVVK